MEMQNGLYYCKSCYPDRLKELGNNKELNDFLYNLCQDSELMPFLREQVTYMVNHNGYKESGILNTLKYIYSHLDNPPVFYPSGGIRYMVTRYYTEARDHYKEIKELEKCSDETIEQAINQPVEIVKLTRSIIEARAKANDERIKNLTYGKEIDLDELPDNFEGVEFHLNNKIIEEDDFDIEWEGLV